MLSNEFVKHHYPYMTAKMITTKIKDFLKKIKFKRSRLQISKERPCHEEYTYGI
jgi:hypothetical protein